MAGDSVTRPANSNRIGEHTRASQADVLLEFLKRSDADTIYFVVDIVEFWRVKRGPVSPLLWIALPDSQRPLVGGFGSASATDLEDDLPPFHPRQVTVRPV